VHVSALIPLCSSTTDWWIIYKKHSRKSCEVSAQIPAWYVAPIISWILKLFFFLICIVVPCILISSKSFIHQQTYYLLILETSKICIKTYIKIAPTCFGPRPPSGSLQLSLAKVTFVLKQLVKLRRYVLCGGVAACYVYCVLCRARQHTVHTPYLDITCCHTTA
jgi:hypothetical protein